MEAALERRRIAKRQAAARAERKRKAAISIALNEKRKEKLKVRHASSARGWAFLFTPNVCFFSFPCVSTEHGAYCSAHASPLESHGVESLTPPQPKHLCTKVFRRAVAPFRSELPTSSSAFITYRVS